MGRLFKYSRLRGLIPRHHWLKAEYYTDFGEMKTEFFEGFVARIFQHEFDHFNGVLFLDRVDSNKDLLSEKEFQIQILGKQ